MVDDEERKNKLLKKGFSLIKKTVQSKLNSIRTNFGILGHRGGLGTSKGFHLSRSDESFWMWMSMYVVMWCGVRVAKFSCLDIDIVG